MERGRDDGACGGVVSPAPGARAARGTGPRGIRPATHPRLTAVLSATLSAAALLAACDDAPSGRDSFAPLEFTAADIEVIGSSDSLAVVQDMEVLSDGSVWVLNSQPPFFAGFGPGGESLGVHGRSGGGPGEFQMPSGFVTGGWEGDAWVFDFARHVITRISKPRESLAVIPLRSDVLPPGSVRGGMNMLGNSVRTARMGHEIILPRSTATMESGPLQFRFALLLADLVAVDPETGAARDLVALGEVLDDPSGDFIASEGAFPLWYRLWAPCGDGPVRVHDRVRNQLRGFDGSGAEVDPIDLPPVPFSEVTPHQFAAAVFRMRQAQVTGDVAARLTEEDSLRVLDRIARTVRGRPDELASYLPRYVDLRCTESGTIWMHPLDPDVGGLSGGRRWLRIAPDGAADPAGAVQDVYLPDGFDAFRFTESRIWGIRRDENDIPSVAFIALPGG